MDNKNTVSRKNQTNPPVNAAKPIRFTRRPALFFVGFATIALSAALFAAYPKWHKQDTENWVYSYVTDRFPGKGVENLQRLAQIIYRESNKLYATHRDN